MHLSTLPAMRVRRLEWAVLGLLSILLLLAFSSPATAARVQVSAGESTGSDYQDMIGGGGTVEGDIFGGEQVRLSPKSEESVVASSSSPSSRAARADVVWFERLWQWFRVYWHALGFTPLR